MEVKSTIWLISKIRHHEAKLKIFFLWLKHITKPLPHQQTHAVYLLFVMIFKPPGEKEIINIPFVPVIYNHLLFNEDLQ